MSDHNHRLVSVDEAYAEAGKFSTYQKLMFMGVAIPFINSCLYLFIVPAFLKFPEVYGCGGTDNRCWNSTQACAHNYYYADKHFNFITEFDLVCDEAIATSIPVAICVGFLIGILICGTTADVIGRLPVLFISNAVNIIGVLLIIEIRNLEATLVLSVIMGIANTGLESPGYSYAFDSMHTDYYLHTTTFINSLWGFAQIFLGFLCWMMLRWRTSLCIIVFFASSFFPQYAWLLESPRFLYSKRRYKEAHKNLEKIAKINKIATPLEVVIYEKSGEEVAASGFIEGLKLLKSPWILYRVLLIGILQFANSFFSFSVMMSVEKLGSSLHVNMIFNGIFEVVGYSSTSFMPKSWNKKIVLAISFALLGGVSVIQFFFHHIVLFSSICMYVGKLGASICFNITYSISAEIFPTSVLGSVLSATLFFSRFGSIVGTIVTVNLTWLFICSLALASLSFICSCLLPKHSPHKEPL